MERQKISVDIDSPVYIKLKIDVLQKRTSMAKVIRGMLYDKYGEELNGQTGPGAP